MALTAPSGGGPSTTTVTTPAVFGPAAFAYGPDGYLYTANQSTAPGGGTGTISKINPATGALVSTITFSTAINPGGLVFAPNGNVYVSNFSDYLSSGSGSIQLFNISGTVATPVGSPVATGLTQPSALLLNGSDLYYTETNTAAVYTGMSNIPGGRLSVVHNVTSTPTVQVLVNGPANTGFAGMALSGSTLYYTDLIGSAIDRFDISTDTALSQLVSSNTSLFGQFPSGLYVDSPTSILVGDLGSADYPMPANGNLRRYSTTTTDTEIGGDIVSGIADGAVINAVPEPGTLLLVGGAAVGFIAHRRRAHRSGRQSSPTLRNLLLAACATFDRGDRFNTTFNTSAPNAR